MSNVRKLEQAIREVMANSSRELSEKEALEAGLNVAEEWKMRLEEIEAEESEVR